MSSLRLKFVSKAHRLFCTTPAIVFVFVLSWSLLTGTRTPLVQSRDRLLATLLVAVAWLFASFYLTKNRIEQNASRQIDNHYRNAIHCIAFVIAIALIVF